MPISDARGVRHVRCPRCHSVLQEPSGVPVYQCGGCGASLRAGNGNTREAPAESAPPSESRLLHRQDQSRRHRGAGDHVASTSASSAPDAAPSTTHRGAGDHVASTSASSAPDAAPSTTHRGASDHVASTSASSAPDAAPSTTHRGAGTTTSRSDTGDLVSARRHSSEQAPPPVVEKKGHGHRSTTSQEQADDSSEPRCRSPNVSANSWGSREAAAGLRDSEKRMRKPEPEAEAARKNGSGDLQDRAAARTTTDSPPAGDVLKLSPLHEKILKTVDELKGDLSELFSKSPEAVKPRTPARPAPPRLPPPGREDSHVSSLPPVPTSRARHAAAAAAAAGVHRRGSAGHVGGKLHGLQAAPRGLPSRRYRRCRADPCARPGRTCRYSCCGHGEPECGGCRSHCCAREPALRRQKPAAGAAREVAKRRAAPRQHCRPVLKGAPFIICSICFTLVQVPAGFAVSSNRVSKLRCGSCSAVLSYSYRDPDGKKKLSPPQSLDGQYSTHGSPESRCGAGEGGARPDLFSFVEDFAHGASCSYSTEDEQPLHVSRNSSFSTVAGAATAPPQQPQSAALHRLMGYGSASELLFLRRSPSLYESFDKRSSTLPPEASRRHYHHDRKGKGVYVDDGAGDDDSDEEDGGALRRSNVTGWTHGGKGVAAPGAIRIRS